MHPRVPRAHLAAVLVVAGLAGPSAADEPRRAQPAVRLELAACLGRDFDSIVLALRNQAPGTDDATTIDVLVDCLTDGLDAGLVIEVRRPDRIRSYLYALDWHAQPPEVRPHLLGLAVSEALAASRIGLIAVPPTRQPADDIDSTGARPVSPSAEWAFSLAGTQRSFVVDRGVGIGGGGLMVSRRVSTHLRASLDVLGEGADVVLSSGTFTVLSVSSSPRVSYRVGGRLHAELGFGARIGMVRIHGPEMLMQGVPSSERVVRAWLGPTTSMSFGLEMTPGVSFDAAFEIGVVEGGANAHDMGLPVVVLGGAWTSFGVAASFAL